MRIALDAIDVPARFDRRTIDPQQLDQLADDIAQHGLIQPIAVRDLGNGRFRLIAGRRRMLATAKLQQPYIEAHVLTTESNDTVLALSENVKRSNISPLEEADVIAHLHDTLGLSIADICEQTGHGTSWVQDRLALSTLDGVLQDAVHARALSIGGALQLSEIDDAEYRNYLVHVARTNGATVHQCQAWAIDYKARKMMTANPNGNGTVPQPPPLPQPPSNPCFVCEAMLENGLAVMVRVCPQCIEALRAVKLHDAAGAHEPADQAGEPPQ